jgi:hypothetical protein
MEKRRRAYYTSSLLVLLACLQSSSAYSRPSSATNLFERRDQPTCKAVDSTLPDSFKCPDGQACISLDSSSSALCCPDGADCSSIGPISCDVKKQDPSQHPDSGVFTKKLTDNLPTCGTLCCPFGYTCAKKSDDTFQCNIDLDKARFAGAFPGGSPTSSSTSASSASTIASSASSTSKVSSTTSTPTALSASNNSTADDDCKCDPFPVGPFFAGLIPGLIVGALAVFLWVGATGRGKKPLNNSPKTPQRFEKRPIISDPIPTQGAAADAGRADFLRRTAKKTISIFSTREDEYRPQAEANPWKMPTPPVPNNVPARPSPPVTPTPAGMHRDHAHSLQTIQISYPRESVQHPSATVSPLRTKKEPPQHDPRFQSPFVSPIRAGEVPRYDNPMRTDSPTEFDSRPVSSVYNMHARRNSSDLDLQARRASPHYELPSGEVLTPQRYEVEAHGIQEATKRDTTFTTLLKHCNIPDSGDPYPNVPPVPTQYKGKRQR